MAKIGRGPRARLGGQRDGPCRGGVRPRLGLGRRGHGHHRHGAPEYQQARRSGEAREVRALPAHHARHDDAPRIPDCRDVIAPIAQSRNRAGKYRWCCPPNAGGGLSPRARGRTLMRPARERSWKLRATRKLLGTPIPNTLHEAWILHGKGEYSELVSEKVRMGAAEPAGPVRQRRRGGHRRREPSRAAGRLRACRKPAASRPQAGCEPSRAAGRRRQARDARMAGPGRGS